MKCHDMKAAAFFEHGSADKLQIVEIDTPSCGPDEVLIAVKAFALNRLDIWTRNGMPSLQVEFPHIGGSDFAGIIKELGSEVTSVAVGDRVVVNPGISCNKCQRCLEGEISLCNNFQLLGEHRWGGAAEFTIAPVNNVLVIPDNISFVEAAATSLTALTSYRMLMTKARARPGDVILIIGSGGGVGTMALQIANWIGAHTIATTSSDTKENKLRELGANHVINYQNTPDWDKEIWSYTNKAGVDIVIDSTGEVVFRQALRCLRKGGRYVTCGATSGTKGEVNIAAIFWKQLEIIGSTMSTHQEFKEALELLFQGIITPVIDSVHQFKNIQQAHLRLEDPTHMGKIVIEL